MTLRELSADEQRAYGFYCLERDAGLRSPSPVEMTMIHHPDLDDSFYDWLAREWVRYLHG